MILILQSESGEGEKEYGGTTLTNAKILVSDVDGFAPRVKTQQLNSFIMFVIINNKLISISLAIGILSFLSFAG